ncbi:hypothetical protein JD507_09150 [Aeromonas jandaei]|jgi:hypothetical protein|uniref:hypothetical protein n=1 Tax=Aeromonas TaxID=642 RepID=UPI00059B68D8|nr:MULTISPECIES: hypothetical protein [Aeromonas]KIQ84772.1 hypothetical protein RW26_01880 [Aeromonas sp. L_1B5_3]MBL0545389.1 hypothetical protein [Aeromonas jandaei]MBL0625684.1 hypothetical protein [Aeromonas jandaei]MCQ4053520.1 hypothetical protein [Aeromonas sp. SG16]QSR72940.1 hypothetical protein GP488_11125 [Aeromonas jandaei]
MKKIGLLLTALLLSPLAMAQTAPAAPKTQATMTWYVAPIVIDESSEAQKALTKDFMAQMIKTIKINEYQTGKAVGNTKNPKWLIRTKLIPASSEPLVGKKHPQGLTYGKGNPTQEIIGELLMNGTLVAHIGQGWREPIVANTPVAERLSVANYRYAVGDQAKSPDLEELAAQIGFEAGKVIHRDGKPLPEKKKKKDQTDKDKG